MKVNYLVLVILSAVLFGFSGPVLADSIDSEHEKYVPSRSRMRRLLNNLSTLSRKHPNISIKKAEKQEDTLESLTSKLRDLERLRLGTRNPFRKIRCLLQESNINRKIRSILRNKKDEEKLEKFEEEFPTDYSPQALSEEGSVPPYVPVVVEDFKEDEQISDSSPKGLQVDPDNYAVSDVDEGTGIEEYPEEQPHEKPGAEETLEDGDDAIKQEVEEQEAQVKEISKHDSSDEEIQKEEGDQSNILDQKELGSTEKTGRGKSRFRRFCQIFRRKKDSIESLLLEKEKIEEKISTTSNKFSKSMLESKLRKVNKKLGRLTDDAIDTVDAIDEVDTGSSELHTDQN
ncbi:putative signal peptide protein [Cryptosporidium canis]|uniref:Signal peptide protein n=1 Tax=Cryptosporidium canis TaxID=195482 RepID=A0ABQ8PBH2_9CRYT|nr:putative signal peptide protein [Cryptosporidium canis]KAJ1615270.1 putative signal peptide protein [Cryptosporidium canis]